jgi:hypothetical protein
MLCVCRAQIDGPQPAASSSLARVCAKSAASGAAQGRRLCTGKVQGKLEPHCEVCAILRTPSRSRMLPHARHDTFLGRRWMRVPRTAVWPAQGAAQKGVCKGECL